jgi:archaellum biogenesis protein FlaJ (TadC family)
MELWMKIAWGAALVMMLFMMWPAYKHWSENGPKGDRSDWRAALLGLGGVVLFVVLLVMMVR